MILALFISGFKCMIQIALSLLLILVSVSPAHDSSSTNNFIKIFKYCRLPYSND